MVRRLALMCIVALFAVGAIAFADEIHLNDGRVIRGRILRVTPTMIEYQPSENVPFDTFPRGQIQKIVYDNGHTVVLNEGKSSRADAPREIGQSATQPVERESAAGVHEHDGFFLRMMLGGAWGRNTVQDIKGSNLQTRGFGLASIFQIGYALTNNLIFYLDDTEFGMYKAKVTWGGIPLPALRTRRT